MSFLRGFHLDAQQFEWDSSHHRDDELGSRIERPTGDDFFEDLWLHADDVDGRRELL